MPTILKPAEDVRPAAGSSGQQASELLRATPLLDFGAPTITALLETRAWLGLGPSDRLGAAYAFIRDEILFGYSAADDLPASRVLADGYGQCNTKGTLLMALLRGLGIPCRLHGFTVHKSLQRGVVPPAFYQLAPRDVLHSWIEVRHGERWIVLEGFILDAGYIHGVQSMFPTERGAFCGYGVGTARLADPPVAWRGEDTFIQKEGINADLGLFSDPDAFYGGHGTNLAGWRRFAYRHFVRHLMNRRVAAIRLGSGG